MVRLRQLIVDLPVRFPPSADAEVQGVCHDSRRVAAGELYVAIVGERFDGRELACEAERRGAVAVLGPGQAPAGLTVPWVGVDDPRPLLGPLAARVYDRPHERLRLAGVTGTNGKSTVIHLLAAIFEAAGEPAGTVGTLGCSFRGASFGAAERTTPEAPDLFRALDEMDRAGAAAVAMEVSSIGLDHGRVAGARFDLALFLNLSRDHLDYHQDMESYYLAKRRLFDQLKTEDGATTGRAVVAVDDAWGRRLAAELPGVLTFGLDGEVTVRDAELDLEGTRGRIATPRGEVAFRSPLLGRYNLLNVLAAVAGAEALGLPHETVVAGIAAVRPLRGRLESVSAGQSFPVLVDYAHTPGGLEAVLASLRELSDRHIAVVFGCGGDRDPGKRVPMGRNAGKLADLAIATSDNPRSEDPLEILNSVEVGLRTSGGQYRLEPDRRTAIHQAVELACKDAEDQWVVLIAGKGHESFQEVGDRRVHFSDQEEALAALAGCGFAARGVDPGRPAVVTEGCHG